MDKSNLKATNLSIYTKYIELIMYTNNLLNKYPKKETFTLAAEIRKNTYTGLSYLVYAIKSFSSKEKIQYLRNLDVQLVLLKVQVRLSYNFKYISVQNYETWCNHITNLSNMLGGWINHVKKD